MAAGIVDSSSQVNNSFDVAELVAEGFFDQNTDPGLFATVL